MAPEDWRSLIDVNLTGVFHGCRAAAPHLIAQRSGKVINLASVLGTPKGVRRRAHPRAADP